MAKSINPNTPYKTSEFDTYDKIDEIWNEYNEKFANSILHKTLDIKEYYGEDDPICKHLIDSLKDDIKKWGNSPLKYISLELLKEIINNEDNFYDKLDKDVFHLNYITWNNRDDICTHYLKRPKGYIHFEHVHPITYFIKSELIENPRIHRGNMEESRLEVIQTLKKFPGICLILKFENDRLNNTYLYKCDRCENKEIIHSYKYINQFDEGELHDLETHFKRNKDGKTEFDHYSYFNSKCRCSKEHISKAGFKSRRPAEHNLKKDDWTYCYALCNINWISRKIFMENKEVIANAISNNDHRTISHYINKEDI